MIRAKRINEVCSEFIKSETKGKAKTMIVKNPSLVMLHCTFTMYRPMVHSITV